MQEQLFSERTSILFFYKFDDGTDNDRIDDVNEKINNFFFDKSTEYEDSTPSRQNSNDWEFEAHHEYSFNGWYDPYIELISDDRKKAIKFTNLMINYIKRFKGVTVYAT